MKKPLIAVLLLIGLIGMDASADDDWEYWSNFEISGTIEENLTLKVKAEPRYNNDCSDHYYTSFDVGIDWKVARWLVISPYYEHVDNKKNGDWQVEERPYLDATVKWKLCGLNFSDRNRLEYRITEDDEFFRYRNKLTVKFPTLTSAEMQPSLAEEPFYDFNDGELNKNRVYGGLDLPIIRSFSAGVYYIFESRKSSGDWTNVNVLKTSLKYKF